MEDLSNWWLFRLAQNLLGYASIAVPGGLLVYYLRKTRYLDSRGEKCIWKCLRSFAYGSESLILTDNGTDSTISSSVQKNTTFHKTVSLLICVSGLLVSYLVWGILQEKIMTGYYVNADGKSEKFSNSQFLVFVNRVLAFVFAATYILISKQPHHRAPLYKYSYCSFSNIMSSWCQYEALKYVSFPTQVLAKASKIIPVMLMGKVLSRKTYKYHEYGTAILISAGMTLFLWSRASVPSESTSVTTVSGVVILLAYMMSDSFTSNWQGELFKQYHMSSVQMMCGVNLFSCIFTSVSLLQQGGFSNSFVFLIEHRTFFTECILLSICSAFGQLFIFYTIEKFGPVVFVIIMTVRQLLAILLSCLIYRHSLTAYGIFGVFIVFTAIFLRIYLNHRTKLKIKTQISVANEPKV